MGRAAGGARSLRRAAAAMPGAPRAALLALLAARLAGGLRLELPPEPEAARRGVESIAQRLPSELVAHVVAHVPGPPRVVWSTSANGAVVMLPGWGGPPKELRRYGGGTTTSARFFPRGRRVATTQSDGRAIVWDALSGRPELVLEMPHIFAVEVLPDGDRIVGISDDRRVVVWSAATGDVLTEFGLPSEHRALRVLDSDRLLTGVSTGAAVIWSISRGAAVHELLQPGGPTNLLEVSPCGTKVFTAGISSAYLWSSSSGQLELRLSDFSDWISHIALTSHGAKLVTSTPGVVRVWNGSTGEDLHTFGRGGNEVSSIALLPEGDRLVVLGRFGLTIWDTTSGSRVYQQPEDLAGFGVRLAVAPDRDYVAACATLDMLTVGPDHYATIDWVAVWDPLHGRIAHTSLEREYGGERPRCGVAVGPAVSVLEMLLE